jgi:hypothetical protein
MEQLRGDSLTIRPLPACGQAALCKVQGPDLRPIAVSVLTGWNPPLHFVYELIVANEGRSPSSPAEVRICTDGSCRDVIDLVVIPRLQGRTSVQIRRSVVPQSLYPPTLLAVQVDADGLSGDAVVQNNTATFPFPPLFAQEPRLIQLSTNVSGELRVDRAAQNEGLSWSLSIQNASAGNQTGPLLTTVKLRNPRSQGCSREYNGDAIELALPSVPPKAIVQFDVVLPPMLKGCAVGTWAAMEFDLVRTEANRTAWSALGARGTWWVR